jgi:transcriptional regulator with XRE-family HTH domain
MATPAEKQVLEALKQMIKAKKVRYADLAADLGVSLPTIKRWLNSSNVSLAQLGEICGALGLEIADLFQLPKTAKGFRFSAEQEEFLASNPTFLAYFYELRKGQSPDEIEKTHGITRTSTRLYLKELEVRGFIRIRPSGRISFESEGTIHWDDHSPLGRTFSREMLGGLTSRALAQYTKKTDLHLQLWGKILTQENFEEMKRDLQKVVEKYGQISEYNRKILPKSAVSHFSCAFIADRWDSEIFSRVKDLS